MLVGNIGGEHVLDLHREASVLPDDSAGTAGLALGEEGRGEQERNMENMKVDGKWKIKRRGENI